MATNAHEYCSHASTRLARQRCRRVNTMADEYRELAMTNHECQELLAADKPVHVRGWRIEDRTDGPVMIDHDGILDRSYVHGDGFTVWIIVSEEKPKGTGHLACQMVLLEDD